MAGGGQSNQTALGFLTIVEHETHGLFGGYLVLNQAGRPLEFHCTAPVRSTRAQEILYGPTLKPFLYGEQIGAALVGKSKTKPQIVCTDQPPVLSLRSKIHPPVALIAESQPDDHHPGADSASADSHYRVDSPRAASAPMVSLRRPEGLVSVEQRFSDDRDRIAAALDRLTIQLELAEPFERIRGAIAEAQRSGR